MSTIQRYTFAPVSDDAGIVGVATVTVNRLGDEVTVHRVRPARYEDGHHYAAAVSLAFLGTLEDAVRFLASEGYESLIGAEDVSL